MVGKINKEMDQGEKRYVVLALVLLVYANILAWLVVYGLTKNQSLEVDFFDVGQGDAFFIETPTGHQVLIDGGPDSTILEKLGREMSFWDRTIDLVVLTHPDHDHLAGLLKVLENYEVQNILWTGVIKESGEYEEWVDLLEKEEAEIIIAEAGQEVLAPGVVFRVLHPPEKLEGRKVKNVNNSSVVLRLVFGNNSLLLLGDLYKSGEKELLERGLPLKSDLLKVAHHGAKTSTDEEFVKTVFPRLAVISVGRNNKYGHPDIEVLEVLYKYGIKVLRTDKEGDIEIISDGRELRVLSPG